MYVVLCAYQVILTAAARVLQDPRGFVAKLSDFGLSMKMAAHDGNVPDIKYGTVQYLSAEVLSTHVMTKKADVYSFGIIMWEVFHSQKAYAHMKKPDVMRAVRSPTHPCICTGNTQYIGARYIGYRVASDFSGIRYIIFGVVTPKNVYLLAWYFHWRV
jgi:serine/threonine protein kinase